MSCVSVRSTCQIAVAAMAAVFCPPALGQDIRDPVRLLQDADKLAWVKAWTSAAPLYGEAERLFTARGDRRNALYAAINRLRGDLPRLAVRDVSQRLAEYLEDP